MLFQSFSRLNAINRKDKRKTHLHREPWTFLQLTKPIHEKSFSLHILHLDPIKSFYLHLTPFSSSSSWLGTEDGGDDRLVTHRRQGGAVLGLGCGQPWLHLAQAWSAADSSGLTMAAGGRKRRRPRAPGLVWPDTEAHESEEMVVELVAVVVL